jgi:high affinity Mn2+ porin
MLRRADRLHDPSMARSLYRHQIMLIAHFKFLPYLAFSMALGTAVTGHAQEAHRREPVNAIPLIEAQPADHTPSAETWAIHGQITNVTQWHNRFQSPYSGTNSLSADGRTEETTDLTIFAGLRLWHGAELWLNPELDQGFGLNNTVGVAGFPSGEAYKIGANTPYLRIPRAFLRQTIELGPHDQPLSPIANQLSGSTSADKVVLTVGKFSATDIFDTNSYAHDPRADFLNWSIIDAGPFDYAADPWGFTYGAAAEWNVGSWTWRGGVFQLSKVPNGDVAGVHFGQYMLVAEAERRYRWMELDGKVKLLGFVNRGEMAAYADAVQLGQATGTTPDVALVRRRNSRSGVTLNIEQALGSDVGAFARLGVNQGSKEAYEFTEINNSESGGLSIKGGGWHRPNDVLGVAVVSNGLAGAARDYFAAGGIGILIGDGQLNYGREQIAEAYYAVQIQPNVSFGLDVQRIVHPAYNRDRGPVTVFGLRAHAEF